MTSGSGPSESFVLGEFMRRLAEDRAAGLEHDVAHYQAMFPGFEDAIAREYERCERDPTRLTGDWNEPTGYALEPGTQLGPYEILGDLGRGGQAEVYRARDTRLGREVALKVLPRLNALSPQARDRFLREAEAASKLDHPNICAVFEASMADDVCYIAMPYVRGRSLRDRIHRASSEGEPLLALPGATHAESRTSRQSLEAAAHLVEKCARALHAAHEEDLVHRDVKPGNVMVTESGEPMILDFGLARSLDPRHAPLTMTGSPAQGTPDYMSPEQIEGKPVDGRSDVFSLGVTLYECLSLERPFEGVTVQQTLLRILSGDYTPLERVDRRIPRELSAIADMALERNPERRYKTAEAMAEDLRRWREHEPIRARPTGPIGRATKWARRKPARAVAVTAIVLIVLGTGSVWGWNAWREARAVSAYCDAGRESLEGGDLTTAAEYAARAAELAPGSAAVRALESRIEDARRSARIDRALTREQAGDLAARDGALETALRQYELAASIMGQGSASLLVKQIDTRLSLGQHEEALAAATELARRAPNHNPGLRAFIEADLALRRGASRAKAEQLLRSAIHRGLPEGLLSLARALSRDSAHLAVPHLQVAARSRPHDLRAHTLLRMALLWSGRLDEAEKEAEVGRRLFAPTDFLRVLDALLEAARGRRDGALDVVDQTEYDDRTRGALTNLVQNVVVMSSIGAERSERALGAAMSVIMAEAVRAATAEVRPVSANDFPEELRAFSFPVDLEKMIAFNFAIAGGKFAQGAEIVQGMLEDHPDGFLHYLEGHCLFLEDQWAEAEKALAAAVETPSLFGHRDVALRYLAWSQLKLANIHGRNRDEAAKRRCKQTLRKCLESDRVMGMDWVTANCMMQCRMKEEARYLLHEVRRAHRDKPRLQAEVAFQMVFVDRWNKAFHRVIWAVDRALRPDQKLPFTKSHIRQMKALRKQALAGLRKSGVTGK